MHSLYDKHTEINSFIRCITTRHQTYRVFVAPFKSLMHFRSEKLIDEFKKYEDKSQLVEKFHDFMMKLTTINFDYWVPNEFHMFDFRTGNICYIDGSFKFIDFGLCFSLNNYLRASDGFSHELGELQFLEGNTFKPVKNVFAMLMEKGHMYLLRDEFNLPCINEVCMNKYVKLKQYYSKCIVSCKQSKVFKLVPRVKDMMNIYYANVLTRIMFEFSNDNQTANDKEHVYDFDKSQDEYCKYFLFLNVCSQEEFDEECSREIVYLKLLNKGLNCILESSNS